ncbi:MAG: hypothetical protein P4L35_09025 [Ignavibacteriaceae bacterium]|nr:hypothetical protein [Ignavibacteriaceae bacterium]
MKKNKGRFNKNRKSSTPQPKMIIVDSYNDPDKSEQAVFDCIEKNIVDASKIREFDCLFTCPDFDTAKELSIYLNESHDYEIVKLFLFKRKWILNAIKRIVVQELRTTLMTAKVTAVGHNCKLDDWNFEVDKVPDQSE